MRIQPFKNLNDGQRILLYEFIMNHGGSRYFSNLSEMTEDYTSVVMNGGESHFSLWEDDQVIGCLGLITKDADLRGEVFIVGVHAAEKGGADVLAALVDHSWQYGRQWQNKRWRMGIADSQQQLQAIVEKNGFRETYKALRLRCECAGLSPRDQGEKMEVVNLDGRSWRDFMRVHNEAFLMSPNGALLTDCQVIPLIKKYQEDPELAGVVYDGKKAVAIYELECLHENIWFIESIGVKPDEQGKGWGHRTLHHIFEILCNRGATGIELTVMSSNHKALELYRQHGFVLGRTLSVWYEKKDSKNSCIIGGNETRRQDFKR